MVLLSFGNQNHNQQQQHYSNINNPRNLPQKLQVRGGKVKDELLGGGADQPERGEDGGDEQQNPQQHSRRHFSIFGKIKSTATSSIKIKSGKTRESKATRAYTSTGTTGSSPSDVAGFAVLKTSPSYMSESSETSANNLLNLRVLRQSSSQDDDAFHHHHPAEAHEDDSFEVLTLESQMALLQQQEVRKQLFSSLSIDGNDDARVNKINNNAKTRHHAIKPYSISFDDSTEVSFDVVSFDVDVVTKKDTLVEKQRHNDVNLFQFVPSSTSTSSLPTIPPATLPTTTPYWKSVLADDEEDVEEDDEETHKSFEETKKDDNASTPTANSLNHSRNSTNNQATGPQLLDASMKSPKNHPYTSFHSYATTADTATTHPTKTTQSSTQSSTPKSKNLVSETMKSLVTRTYQQPQQEQRQQRNHKGPETSFVSVLSTATSTATSCVVDSFWQKTDFPISVVDEPNASHLTDDNTNNNKKGFSTSALPNPSSRNVNALKKSYWQGKVEEVDEEDEEQNVQAPAPTFFDTAESSAAAPLPITVPTTEPTTEMPCNVNKKTDYMTKKKDMLQKLYSGSEMAADQAAGRLFHPLKDLSKDMNHKRPHRSGIASTARDSQLSLGACIASQLVSCNNGHNRCMDNKAKETDMGQTYDDPPIFMSSTHTATSFDTNMSPILKLDYSLDESADTDLITNTTSHNLNTIQKASTSMQAMPSGSVENSNSQNRNHQSQGIFMGASGNCNGGTGVDREAGSFAGNTGKCAGSDSTAGSCNISGKAMVVEQIQDFFKDKAAEMPFQDLREKVSTMWEKSSAKTASVMDMFYDKNFCGPQGAAAAAAAASAAGQCYDSGMGIVRISCGKAGLSENGRPKQERPYFDEKFTLDFLHTIMAEGLTLLYMQPPNNKDDFNMHWKGRTVHMTIVPGTTEDGVVPRLEWTTVAGGRSMDHTTTMALTLFEISSLRSGDQDDGDENEKDGQMKTCKTNEGLDDTLNNSMCDLSFFTITSNKGDVHVFEAASIEDRDKIVTGLRNVIAWLTFHLVTGDATASSVLYNDDFLRTNDPANLPMLTKGTPHLAMNQTAHALLDP